MADFLMADVNVRSEGSATGCVHPTRFAPQPVLNGAYSESVGKPETRSRVDFPSRFRSEYRSSCLASCLYLPLSNTVRGASSSESSTPRATIALVRFR